MSSQHLSTQSAVCHDCREVYPCAEATAVSVRTEQGSHTAYVCAACAADRRGETVDVEKLRSQADFNRRELVRIVLADADDDDNTKEATR